MIFKRDLLKLVLEGKKTETRREWKTCKVKIGRTYAVRSSRFEKAQGKVLIIGVTQDRLGDITEEGAHREGCASKAEFVKLWEAIHNGRTPYSGRKVKEKYVWTPETQVWVVRFTLFCKTEATSR